MRPSILMMTLALLGGGGCIDDRQNDRLDSLEFRVGYLGAHGGVTKEVVSAAVADEASARGQAVASAAADARSYCDKAVASEAAARTGADDQTLTAAKTYTDDAIKQVMPSSTKLPHLIVDQTNEDLGQLLTAGPGGDNLVWNTKLNGEIDVTRTFLVFFERGGCDNNGSSWISDTNPRIGKYYHTTLNKIAQGTAPATMVQYQSTLQRDGSCTTGANSALAVPYVLVNKPSLLHNPNELRVVMR